LGARTQTSHSLTQSTYNTRGDAVTQAIQTYHVAGVVETLVSDVVNTNRTFDANHNVVNQLTLSYVVNKLNQRVLFDVKETRSIGFHVSGVAAQVTTATYSNDQLTVLGVQVVTNANISADGRVGNITVTKYAGRAAADIKDGTINPIGKQSEDLIYNKTFDAWGNALTQDITSTSYKDDGVTILSTDYKSSTNVYDIYARATQVTSATFATSNRTLAPTQTQVLNYTGFDAYGNSTNQTIKTYVGVVAPANFSSIRSIVNVYDDPVARKKGNATSRRTYRSSSILSRSGF